MRFGTNGVWYRSFDVPSGDPVTGVRSDYGPVGSDSATKIGSSDLNLEFFPVVSFYASTILNTAVVDVTIYGNDTAPFNYPVPAGYNI